MVVLDEEKEEVVVEVDGIVGDSGDVVDVDKKCLLCRSAVPALEREAGAAAAAQRERVVVVIFGVQR